MDGFWLEDDLHPGLPHLRATAQLKESSGPVALVLFEKTPTEKTVAFPVVQSRGKPRTVKAKPWICVIRCCFFLVLGGIQDQQ